jgi:hypothetical protein
MLRARTHAVGRALAVLAVAALAVAPLASCALTAPAPGGSLRQGAFLQVQPSWALGYGPATARVHEGSVIIALAPWFLLHGGAAQAGSGSWVIDDYSQAGGASLLFSIGGGGTPHPFD